LSDIYTVLVFS